MHPQKSAPIGVLPAVFGGTFGLHRFYLGDTRAGWLYVLLCWTALPRADPLRPESAIHIIRNTQLYR